MRRHITIGLVLASAACQSRAHDRDPQEPVRRAGAEQRAPGGTDAARPGPFEPTSICETKFPAATRAGAPSLAIQLRSEPRGDTQPPNTLHHSQPVAVSMTVDDPSGNIRPQVVCYDIWAATIRGWPAPYHQYERLPFLTDWERLDALPSPREPLVIRAGVPAPREATRVLVRARLVYEAEPGGPWYAEASKAYDITPPCTRDARYLRYRSGLIRRHIVDLGRLLQWTWLKEYEPDTDPRSLLQLSRVSRTTDGRTRVYVPWTFQCAETITAGAPNAFAEWCGTSIIGGARAIYTSNENPLGHGGLAMATLALEYLSLKTEDSLEHALELLEYVERSEWRDAQGRPTGFFLRARWPGNLDHSPAPLRSRDCRPQEDTATRAEYNLRRAAEALKQAMEQGAPQSILRRLAADVQAKTRQRDEAAAALKACNDRAHPAHTFTCPGCREYLHASADEIIAMTLGLYYLHQALQRAPREYAGDAARIERIVGRLGDRLAETHYLLVPPGGLPQELHKGWAGLFAFQWFVQRGFRAITGRDHRPADMLSPNHALWQRVQRIPAEEEDTKGFIALLLGAKMDAADRAEYSIPAIGAGLYYRVHDVRLRIRIFWKVWEIDLTKDKMPYWNLPMLLHAFQLGMAVAPRSDSERERVASVKKRMGRLIKGLVQHDAKDEVPLLQFLHLVPGAFMGSRPGVVATIIREVNAVLSQPAGWIKISIPVGGWTSDPDLYAAAVAVRYGLVEEHITEAVILRGRELFAEESPAGRRPFAPIRPLPARGIGKSFVWESAPGTRLQDAGEAPSAGMEDDKLRGLYGRGKDAVLEGSGLGYLLPMALVRHANALPVECWSVRREVQRRQAALYEAERQVALLKQQGVQMNGALDRAIAAARDARNALNAAENRLVACRSAAIVPGCGADTPPASLDPVDSKHHLDACVVQPRLTAPRPPADDQLCEAAWP